MARNQCIVTFSSFFRTLKCKSSPTIPLLLRFNTEPTEKYPRWSFISYTRHRSTFNCVLVVAWKNVVNKKTRKSASACERIFFIICFPQRYAIWHGAAHCDESSRQDDVVWIETVCGKQQRGVIQAPATRTQFKCSEIENFLPQFVRCCVCLHKNDESTHGAVLNHWLKKSGRCFRF